MIAKMSRLTIFLYTFLLLLLLLFFSGILFFHGVGVKNWLIAFVQVKIFYIPISAYLFFLAFSMSLFINIVLYFIRRKQYGRLEENIRILSSENYDIPLFEKKIPHAEDDEYIPEIEKDLKKIKQKMLSMSQELQVLSSKPELVKGESKEMILQEERKRLARELHDSVSQQLFAATMMLSAVTEEADKQEISPSLYKQLKMVSGIINTSQSEMRALLLHLRPINLEGKSLKKGIEQLLVELKTKIKIDLFWEIDDVVLPTGIEDHLFRIVQELLSNTLRHAKASSLDVFLNQTNESVSLRVVDDGVGFDVNQKKLGSYGLQNICERVSGMGGSCKIISFKNKGTSIEIKIPIVKGEVG